jgi:hypothetical protein
MFLVAGSAVLKKEPKGPKIEESHVIAIDYAFKCQHRVRVFMLTSSFLKCNSILCSLLMSRLSVGVLPCIVLGHLFAGDRTDAPIS